MRVAEFEVEVERKNIKNLHLSVYPPDGRVHLSAPAHLSDWDISTFLFSKLAWIRKQRESVLTQHRQDAREFVTGESHYLFGERYLLELKEADGKPKVKVTNGGIDMLVTPGMTKAERSALLYTYYRRLLLVELNEMIERWRPVMDESGVPIYWSVDMLLRKWGQCFKKERRIVFSLLLARVPRRCIEYVVVHELAHLKVHPHNDDFHALLDRYLPDWRSRKQELDNFIALALPI